VGVQTIGRGRIESGVAGSRKKPQSDQNFSEHKPAFELKYRNRTAEMIRKTQAVQSVFEVCNEYTSDWL